MHWITPVPTTCILLAVHGEERMSQALEAGRTAATARDRLQRKVDRQDGAAGNCTTGAAAQGAPQACQSKVHVYVPTGLSGYVNCRIMAPHENGTS